MRLRPSALMDAVPNVGISTSVMTIGALMGDTKSFTRTLRMLPLLSCLTFRLSIFATVGFLSNIGILLDAPTLVPRWAIEWFTVVSVQSLPTSVMVNWTAVVASATWADSVVASGMNPSGGV